MTTLIALLLISGAQQSAPLDRLHELAKSDRPDRFEEIVHYVESAPSEAEARDGMKVLSEAVGELSKRLAALHSLPPTQREARYLELDAPFEGNAELVRIDADVAMHLVRDLFATSGSKRVKLIEDLAGAAGADWPIEDDETYFGPRCGTYDHTNEEKIMWASRHYPAESLDALRQPGWSGRRQLMIALNNYGYGLKSPEFGAILKKLAYDPNTLVRGEAILALGNFPGRDVEVILTNSLTNRAADTRAKALCAAAMLKTVSVERIATRLLDDEDVADEAISYLGAIGTDSAKMQLIRCLGNRERLWPTLQAIQEAKATEAVPYLVEMLDKASEDDFDSILDTLIAVDPDRGADEVERALRSTDQSKIQSAIGRAGSMKLQRTRPLLQRLVASKNEDIRNAAVEALKELDARTSDR